MYVLASSPDKNMTSFACPKKNEPLPRQRHSLKFVQRVRLVFFAGYVLNCGFKKNEEGKKLQNLFVFEAGILALR